MFLLLALFVLPASCSECACVCLLVRCVLLVRVVVAGVLLLLLLARVSVGVCICWCFISWPVHQLTHLFASTLICWRAFPAVGFSSSAFVFLPCFVCWLVCLLACLSAGLSRSGRQLKSLMGKWMSWSSF